MCSKFDIKLEVTPPDSGIIIEDEKKVDILTLYWMSLRARIGVWEDRAYNVTVWSAGLLLSATGYCLIHLENLLILHRLLIAAAFLLFGALTQVYLGVAHRSFGNTGMAIDRVQAALRLCEPGQYLGEEQFFGYSGRYLRPRIITILQWFHMVGLVFAIVVVIWVP